MKNKVVTFEQLIAAALANYRLSLRKVDIFDLINFVNQLDGYDFINSSLIDIQEYILIEKDNLRIKNTRSIDMPIIKNPNMSLREWLMRVAGIDSLNIINFYTSKGCVNCINDSCGLAYSGKNEYESYLPIGNNCLKWENNYYKRRMLQKK